MTKRKAALVAIDATFAKLENALVAALHSYQPNELEWERLEHALTSLKDARGYANDAKALQHDHEQESAMRRRMTQA